MSATSSPASFSGLPTELKAIIVRMASDQDRARRSRRPRDPFYNYSSNSARGRDYGSVWSLSLTSRELNALTARHIFKSTTARKCLMPVFKWSVISQRSAFISEVSFVDLTQPEEARIAFSLLVALPNVFTLSLDEKSARALLGPTLLVVVDETPPHWSRHASPEQQERLYDEFYERRRQADEQRELVHGFRSLAARISHLELIDFDHTDGIIILDAFRILRRLTIQECGRPSRSSDLFEAVRARQELHTLQLYLSPMTHYSHLLGDWSLVASSVRHLALGASATQQAWHFISHFSKLETPSLDFSTRYRSGSPQRTASPVLSAAFPCLTQLRLVGPPSAVVPLFSHFASSPLCDVTIEVDHGAEIEPGHPLLSALVQILPTLRYLTFEGQPYDYGSKRTAVFSFKSSAFIRDVVLGHGNVLRFNDQGLYPLDAFDYTGQEGRNREPEPRIEDMQASVENLLQWTQRKIAQLRVVGDEPGMQRLMKLLKSVKQEQLDEKD